MNWLLLLIGLTGLWLLWRIARNTGDVLDRCAAIQVELAALNRRLGTIERTVAGDNAGNRRDTRE